MHERWERLPRSWRGDIELLVVEDEHQVVMADARGRRS
jgi:hypothetical protein